MSKPGEYKTVQARILKYAQEIKLNDDVHWVYVSRSEAENRRGFDSSAINPQEKVRHASLFFDDLLYQKAREFNPLYSEAPGALVSQLTRLQASIYGNREF